MNKYLVVRWRTSGARSHLWEEAMAGAWEWIPFAADRAHLYRLDDRTDLLAAELQHPALDTGPFTAVSDGGALTFDGLPHLAGRALGAGAWAESLRELLRRHTAEEAQAALRGAFSLCWCAPDRTISAFADFAGLSPLYYLEQPDYVAISNRQSMLSALHAAGGRGGYDLLGLSWLTGQTMMCGSRMAHRDVKNLPTGHELRISGSRCTVERFERPFWSPHGGAHAPLTPEDFDHAAGALLENYRALASMPAERFSLSLTGGKDSRLNLAATLSTPLRDKLDETFTFGPPDSPEIECASHVAGAVGVPHRAAVGRTTTPDMTDVWLRLRQHVYRFEASVCPWDGTGPAARGPGRLQISGMGGELYHKNNKNHRHLRIRDLAHAKEVFANWQQPMDPLGVQHPWVTDWQRGVLNEWLEDRHREGVPLDDLDEVAYAEFRLPMWGGAITSNTAAGERFFPLVHPTILALCYRGGVTVRQTQWMHYELMRRLRPELVELPFLADPWDPRLRSELGADVPDVPAFASSRPATSRHLVTWQWKFLETESQEIAELLLGSPHSGLFDLYDRAVVERVIPQLRNVATVPAVKSVLSLVAIQLALTGGFVAVDEHRGAPRGECELRTNVEGCRIVTSEGRQRLDLGTGTRHHLVRRLDAVAAAHPLLRRRRALLKTSSSVVGDWPAEQIAALTERFADGGGGLPDGLAETLPTYEFDVPSEGTRRLRVDPTDRPDVLVIAPATLTSADGWHATLAPDVEAARWHSRHLRPLRTAGGLYVFESTGNDPWFLLEAPPRPAGRPGPWKLRVAVLAPRGGRMEVFWDDGEGFSEQRKTSVRMTASLFSLALVHLLLEGTAA